jgi:hypothetical protein
MSEYRVEINPQILSKSDDPDKDGVTLGFSIKPPLYRKPIFDPGFLKRAADQLNPVGRFKNAIIERSNLTMSYGRFETFGMDIDDVLRHREEVVSDAQSVFELALNTIVEVVMPDQEGS